MNNAPTAAGEDCILASLERPSNYRLYYKGSYASTVSHRIPEKISLAFLLFLLLTGCDASNVLIRNNGVPIYYGTIDSIDSVYDGDTIRDVSIQIYPFR